MASLYLSTLSIELYILHMKEQSVSVIVHQMRLNACGLLIIED